jgi:hypothetical protein
MGISEMTFALLGYFEFATSIIRLIGRLQQLSVATFRT